MFMSERIIRAVAEVDKVCEHINLPIQAGDDEVLTNMRRGYSEGEHRHLVRRGLRALAQTQRPGVRALLAVAGGGGGPVDTETIGFGLGRRLNAAGRLGHARLAFDLLVCEEEERAQELAAELDALNRERRRATDAALALAGELVVEEEGAPLIMLGHPEFPLGIVGLVAARLAEQYHRPAIIYQRGEKTSRASARSIEGFDVTAALRTCPGCWRP